MGVYPKEDVFTQTDQTELRTILDLKVAFVFL